jgi:hypothetical protein
MKVGDLVIFNVFPKGWDGGPLSSVQGIIISHQMIPAADADDFYGVKNQVWWFIMRSDTGTIKKYHDDWIKAGENESW